MCRDRSLYWKHVNQSSFHIYLKHEINMNKHQKVFYLFKLYFICVEHNV